MALALVALPLVFALVAFVVPSNSARPWVLIAGGAAHLALVVAALFQDDVTALDRWLVFGPFARPTLAFVSVLFFVSCVYARGYLRYHAARANRTFVMCMLAFIAMITLALLAQHLGLMWLAIESTTLASAPLMYFERTPRALEATWKYLLVGSVGIAIALLGSLFLAYSALAAGLEPNLLLDEMVRDAPRLSRPWLHSAFLLLFVGYGTKMGLAPMHAWKPDAYGEAPGLVATLLAGCLAHAAFIAILRFYKVCLASGDAGFARDLMIVSGLLSMLLAGVFMARQKDIKRLLAYSSVEHMGILVVGAGIGGGALFGSLLHMVNNGLTKGALFLAAANLHRAYGSKSTDDVRGALRRLPVTGALMLAGFFAITGSPPFGPFVSELAILEAAIAGGHHVIAIVFLVALVVVFVGMSGAVLTVVQGEPPAKAATGERERFSTAMPGVVLMTLVLVLGVHVPRPLEALLRDAAAFIEVGP